MDCNDLDYDINPGEIDVCGNGIDENCDGNVDETCVSTMAVTTAIRSSGPFDTFSSVTSTGVAVPPTQPPVKFFTTGTITSPLALQLLLDIMLCFIPIPIATRTVNGKLLIVCSLRVASGRLFSMVVVFICSRWACLRMVFR